MRMWDNEKKDVVFEVEKVSKWSEISKLWRKENLDLTKEVLHSLCISSVVVVILLLY